MVWRTALEGDVFAVQVRRIVLAIAQRGRGDSYQRGEFSESEFPLPSRTMKGFLFLTNKQLQRITVYYTEGYTYRRKDLGEPLSQRIREKHRVNRGDLIRLSKRSASCGEY